MNINQTPILTKKEQVYRRLRGELLSHRLLPGDRLSEIPLAARLGVSRIPLREAIDQLASEGLVDRVPGLGSHVRSASPKVLREIYEMREVLECFTVEKAAGRMSGAQLGGLGDLCGEIGAALGEYRRSRAWTSVLRERLVSADLAFHQTIAQAAGNDQIRREIERLQAVSELLSYRPDLAQDEMKAMTRSAREHLGILEALRRSNGRLARRRMTEHIRRASERAIILLEAATRLTDRRSKGGPPGPSGSTGD
ncbi:MAG TPA: GntR family transcriptional regulator [Planctomycetota bacterium]|nr:GntR family transcriptional regulator [Planctomycetota bacterium]